MKIREAKASLLQASEVVIIFIFVLSATQGNS